MAVLQLVVLVLLVATAALGLVSLRAWWRHRGTAFPARRIAAHVVLQLASIGLWTAFVIGGALAVGWIAFVVITAGQVLGDLLMFASHRARRGVRGKASYRAVARDVLGFSRPAPALHAILGALGWFGMLAACAWASLV